MGKNNPSLSQITYVFRQRYMKAYLNRNDVENIACNYMDKISEEITGAAGEESKEDYRAEKKYFDKMNFPSFALIDERIRVVKTNKEVYSNVKRYNHFFAQLFLPKNYFY